MGRGLTPTQVELTFASVKFKGRRRITFDQFTDALSLFAEKRGQDLKIIVDLILSSHGPQAKGTQPDFVKFHDDKVRGLIYPMHLGLQSIHLHKFPKLFASEQTHVSSVSLYKQHLQILVSSFPHCMTPAPTARRLTLSLYDSKVC